MAEESGSFLHRLATFFKESLATLFVSNRGGPHHIWVERAWLFGLYLLGALAWSFFLNFGKLRFDLHDWTQEGPRYFFLRASLLRLEWPLYIGSPLASTERFLAIPDTIISPQVFLLRYLEPATFVLFNTLLLYSLGFIGLLLIRRRLRFSAVTFTLVFLLFALNGHILAHVAVGHSMWVSYFLLPFFGYLVLRLLDGDSSWTWVTGMAVFILALFLNGGFHFVVYCSLFLLALGLARRRHLWTILKGLLFGGLLSLARILPAALEFGMRDKPFISGYFSLTDLISAFITLKPPWEALSGLYVSLGWWEVSVYVGLLGFAVLMVFGVYFTITRFPPEQGNLRVLLIPILVLTVLSIGKIYQPIATLPLPLLNAERVASRFIILPVFFTILLAGINIDNTLKEKRPATGWQVLILLGTALVAHDLLQNARLWRVEMMAKLFEITPVDIRAEVLSLADATYTNGLIVGLLVGLGALAYLLVRIVRERRARAA